MWVVRMVTDAWCVQIWESSRVRVLAFELRALRAKLTTNNCHRKDRATLLDYRRRGPIAV